MRKIQSAILNRLRILPFRFGRGTLFAGTYRSYVPDRYWSHYTKVGRLTEPAIAPGSKEAFLAGNIVNNGGDLARYYFFLLLREQIAKEKILGDVAELGVYKGNTAVLLVQIARDSRTTAYLFDTFDGFSGKDLVGIDDDKRERAQFDDTSLRSVQELIGEQNVKYVKGRFPESAVQVPADARFSVVHIDCDLYAPFLSALHFFYPRLVPGGFLIMHDYSSQFWKGAEVAVDEFFATKQERVILLPDKSGTAVVRKV